MKLYTYECQECKVFFETKRKNKKFCSRSCYSIVDSRRKKEKFSQQPHHNLGRKASEEERVRRSKKTSDTWKVDIIRKSRIDAMHKWIEEHGVNPGWTDDAVKKRNETVESNGGHNFKGSYGTRKCDVTFKERYGMTSHEYRTKRLRSIKKTSPEILAESLLEKTNHAFTYQYKFKNRYFDFALEDSKILIEIDGDYWHGKDIPYNSMNEQQRATFRNDRYKDDLVNKSEWKLIRIWASDLEVLNAEQLQNIIHAKENTNQTNQAGYKI